MTKENAIKYLKQLYPNGGHCWLDEQRIEAIGMAVKALQEESTGNPFGSTHAEFRTAVESLGISQEEHDRIVDECIYGKEPELVDADDLPKEEPVSEELEEAMQHNAPDNIGIDDLLYWRNGFITGANWKVEQFEKNRLAHCDAQTEEEAEIEADFVMGIIEIEHRQPTFDDAIKYGMKLQKKQMINDAYEREVKVDAGGYPYIPQMELYDYDKDIPLAKEGDKVKVIVIKED